MKKLFNPLGFIVGFLIMIWIFECSLYDQPICGEIGEEVQNLLEYHPCIDMAELQYDCVEETWEGWVILDSTHTVEVSHKSQFEVANALKNAADNFHYADPPRIEIDIYKFKD